MTRLGERIARRIAHSRTPILSLPMGQSFGLPAGLSLLAGAYQESLLLRIGHAFEQTTQLRTPPKFRSTAFTRRIPRGPSGGASSTSSQTLPLAWSEPGVDISIAMSTPGSVGPPWISLEMPANPLDPETRNAVLVVRAYHHATPAGYSLAGTAEGVVNGERRAQRSSSPDQELQG